MSENPKVFISYSHVDRAYEDKVLAFANRLRKEGIDANVDLYEEAPAEGWPRWMEKQITESDYVVVINSESYYNKFYNNTGKGVEWEANIIYQFLYDSCGNNDKFIPVFFEETDKDYILTPIKGYTYYNIGSDDGFDSLYWRLRGVTRREKPPLGTLRPLPEKERKTMFFSTPIDVEKWNEAGWKGIVYLFYPNKAPIMGFLFKNYSVGKKIFKEWQTIAHNDFADSFLTLTYVIPPLPKDCWILKENDGNNGNGYFVLIDANVDEAILRAKKAGIDQEEYLITTISRFRWMPEMSGSKNRDMLQEITSKGYGYIILPIGMKEWSYDSDVKEDNLLIDFSDMVKMKKLSFKKGIDIDENDLAKVVFCDDARDE